MQEKNLYEYAVIRIMPRVEREEFLNVGVVLYCAGKKFLQAKYLLGTERVISFCHTCDLSEIETYLKAFEQIANGAHDAGPISKLATAARFRWLTATRSTVVQTSKVHPGMCIEPAAVLQKLFNDLVR
ncbi:MAG: DUF3037 domain-containing protein [Ferruginibacter sp.]|nr:DUF3037 domain-containing protein [Ferruginibacter sp.]